MMRKILTSAALLASVAPAAAGQYRWTFQEQTASDGAQMCVAHNADNTGRAVMFKIVDGAPGVVYVEFWRNDWRLNMNGNWKVALAPSSHPENTLNLNGYTMGPLGQSFAIRIDLTAGGPKSTMPDRMYALTSDPKGMTVTFPGGTEGPWYVPATDEIPVFTNFLNCGSALEKRPMQGPDYSKGNKGDTF
jgi:hypothetical protein